MASQFNARLLLPALVALGFATQQASALAAPAADASAPAAVA
jgi:hypothetical protein